MYSKKCSELRLLGICLLDAVGIAMRGERWHPSGGLDAHVVLAGQMIARRVLSPVITNTFSPSCLFHLAPQASRNLPHLRRTESLHLTGLSGSLRLASGMPRRVVSRDSGPWVGWAPSHRRDLMYLVVRDVLVLIRWCYLPELGIWGEG
jgi:hypothetical protein